MIHRLNLNKLIFLLSFLLFFACDDNSLETISCHPLYEDDCGKCVQCDETCECDIEPCDWNLDKDNCNQCFGDNSTCTGCTDELATNFDVSATISCISCCDYSGNMFIHYSDELGFNPSIHETSIGIPIYWKNYSDHSILIQTENSPQPECIQDSDSYTINTDCNTYDSYDLCENLNIGCIWDIPASYNPDWDNFEKEIPPYGGIINPIDQYYFIGFSAPTGYIYYYEHDNEIDYGFINITDN